MTNPYIALEGVSFVLPDGRTLFSDLDEQFDQQPTGPVSYTHLTLPTNREV